MKRVNPLTLIAVTAVVVASLCGCGNASRGDGTPRITERPLQTTTSGTSCQAASMSGTLQTGPEVVAGSGGHGVSIRLRNESERTCDIRGFISVVYLSDEHGPSFGEPAERDQSGNFSNRVVHVAPEHEAAVPMSNVFGGPSCNDVPFWGYSVTLPGQDSSIRIPVAEAGTASAAPLNSVLCSTAHMVVAPVQDPTTM